MIENLSSYLAKHWREANEALIAEVGERVRKSVAEAKEEANRELEEAHAQLDIAVKNEAKIKETLDRAIRYKNFYNWTSLHFYEEKNERQKVRSKSCFHFEKMATIITSKSLS